MKLENIQKLLQDGDMKEMNAVFGNRESQLLDEETFHNLCGLLKNENSKVRFFSLFYIIDQFKTSLSKASENLANTLYELIFDEYGPVVDRAIWALGITGNVGLDKLLNEYIKSSNSTKSRIVSAIGRSNFSHRIAERTAILIDAIESENAEIRFTAMCELMANSPAGSWKKNAEADIDFDKIYLKILPIAKHFSQSQSICYREFAERHIKQIQIKMNGKDSE